MSVIDQALASYREATKSFETADPEEVRHYRAWMDEQSPLDKKEMRFLEYKGDLMALRHTPVAEPLMELGKNSLSHATLALPLVLLLPLLTFKVITGFLGRILILVIIGYTEAAIVSSNTGLSQLMSYRSWTICAAA